MAHAVVDQFEAVQVQEQDRERHPVAQARTLDRMAQAIEQVGTVGQAGQVVVQGLVGQALLGTQAFADLGQQLLVGLLQLDGARDHALFQLGVGRAQPLLGTLPGQAIADVVGHEGEQALVVHAEPDRRVVALHHHRAHHLVLPVQRHPQPAAGLVAVLVGLAGRHQRLDHGAIGQQGLAGLQDVLGQAVAEPARRALAAGFVHRIDELDRLPVLAEHGDVEVARIDQLVHRRMHLGVVLLQGFGAHRHLGYPEQRMLQALGTLALQHLLLQLAVGLLQLQGPLAHPAFQFGLGLAPVQGGQHVLGHVAQQRAVLIAVAAGAVIALDHDRATDAVATLHRHAQPVHRLGPLEVGARHLQQLPHSGRRTAQGLAVAQQAESQAAGQFAFGPLLLFGRHIGVDLVGEVDEAHRPQVLVTGDQVAVGCIHQRGDDPVQAAQHAGHLDLGTGQLGDLVQRLLQSPRLFQSVGPGLGAGRLQGRVQQGPGGGHPGLAGAVTEWRGQPGQHRQPRSGAVLPGQGQRVVRHGRKSGFGRGQLQPRQQVHRRRRLGQEMLAQFRVAPAQRQPRPGRQQRVQHRQRPRQRCARSRVRARGLVRARGHLRRVPGCAGCTHATPARSLARSIPPHGVVHTRATPRRPFGRCTSHGHCLHSLRASITGICRHAACAARAAT